MEEISGLFIRDHHKFMLGEYNIQHFGNYDLVRRLAVGGMGEVYLARQRTAFGREVAVKIIRSDLVYNLTARQRFLREAEVNAYLKHDHILPLVEFGEEQGHLPAEKVERLIAGLPSSFEDPRQQVVYELASTLAEARVVPVGLYRRAHDLLGDAGIVDVTALMGWFTTVSLTLMAFDVPSSAKPFDETRI